MRTACLLATLLLGACGPSMQSAPGPGLILEVVPDAVSAGDRVELVLGNGTSGTVGYNLCTSALERRAGGGWEAVPSERVCTMELRTLDPGGEDRYSLELPAGLDPGEYRFTTAVEDLDAGSRTDVASDPFVVSS